MPAVSPLFTGFRQRRLQSFAARLSQAPANSWVGVEALPYLYHEQLTQGARFCLPLQPSTRFTPASATEAARALLNQSRHTVLLSLASDFDDSDYLSIWELLESTGRSLPGPYQVLGDLPAQT